MMSEQPNEQVPLDHRLPEPTESRPDHRLPAPPEGAVYGEEKPKSKSRRPLFLFLLVFLIVFGLVVLFGWLSRRGDREDTKKRSDEAKNAKPVVETEMVKAATSTAGLVVPGTTIPLTQAYVYARANGYLKRRLVDIGDHVKKDQLLAVVDSPDLDAQVIQAREQVAQAEQQLEQQKSQLALANVTVQRYRVLVTKGVFSRQDGDQQEANFQSAAANVAAAQRNVDAYKANLQHQIALQSYEQVRAPFAGVITERNVDVGALISAAGASSGSGAAAPMGQSSSAGGTTQAGQSNNAGSSGNVNSAATSAQSPGQGGPLFGIAQVQRLRILVSVPEGYATAIHVHDKAPIAVQELPTAKLFAEVTRTADSIDPNTRTMLTELQIDNTQGKLISGMYAVVTFPAAQGAGGPLLINGDAVVVRHDLSMVATVANGKVHYVAVTLGRDFGSEIEILTGLKPGDLVVTDVTDDVAEGVEVKTHDAKAQGPQAPPPQSVPPGGSTQYGDPGISDQNLQGQQSQQKGKGGQSGNKSGAKKSSSESKP